MKKTALFLAIGSSLLVTNSAIADVSVYGRITYNMLKDDTSKDVYFGRHEFAESNFGLKGTFDYGNVKFGAQLEVGLDEGVSNVLHTEGNSRTRIQELSIAGDFGKVKLGTGAGITWIISDVDQSGTWWSDPLGMSQRFGASRRGPAAESQTPLVQAQSIFNERIIYESPTFLDGAKFYAQMSEASGYEVAIKYVANGWRVNIWNVDYGDVDRDDDPQANIDENTTAGFLGATEGRGILAGYKHSSGVNFTATYGTADQVDDSTREYLNWKLGYTKDKHAVSISMGNYSSEDAAGVSGADHTRTTLAYNFKPLAGVQLWAQATKGDTDDQESFNALVLGGLVKF
ncbi:porin [Colwellia sp. 4_MG-2023]|uniref:porin n=1 Tax=unclassified Colwellia TaxID=196834 RepID=UPI0026E32B24|nr:MULTISPECIES: porin [unclassified Colwellia]MDO6507398.1 porin [Colwellia sp. 5_MG-2023]MDO6556182.1 porin [Colwellia sp. 4_MG-2023]